MSTMSILSDISMDIEVVVEAVAGETCGTDYEVVKVLANVDGKKVDITHIIPDKEIERLAIEAKEWGEACRADEDEGR